MSDRIAAALGLAAVLVAAGAAHQATPKRRHDTARKSL